MKKVFFNLSMTAGQINGVVVYSRKLQERIKNSNQFKSIYLYIKRTKFLSFYRIFWNFFILPFKVKNNFVYSFSTHGSPFISNQIITIHDLICFAYPKQHKFQYYYFKYLVPLIIRSSKKVVAISNFTKSEIIKYYNLPESKIEVVYNGFNKLETVEDSQTVTEFNDLVGNSKYFITVGASYPHKNIEKLLHSVKKLNNPNAKFIIVGKNNKYGKFLRSFSDELNLSNVIFVDFVSDNLLAMLYKNAICNLYISSYEGFGFPPLEAAGFGTTSLVSDIPIMREVLGDNAYYVDSSDSDKIADKIREIYDMRKEDLHKNKDLTGLISKYSWDESSQKIIDIIKRNL